MTLQPKHTEIDDPKYRKVKTYEWLKPRMRGAYAINAVLDIGEANPMGRYLAERFGVNVHNTEGDLDYEINTLHPNQLYDVVWCFEVIEHLLNPRMFFDNLHGVTTDLAQVFVSYPSRPKLLWNNRNHFHEYDKLRFDYLLHVTGWEIVDHGRIRLMGNMRDWWKYFRGFRPLLRIFFDFTEIYQLRKIQ